MKNNAKILIWFIVSLVGFAMYIALYFLVPYVKQFNILKYLIVILGYISILVFPLGCYNFIKEIKNKNQNK